MATGFENMALAGADGIAVESRSSARKQGGMSWRDYLVNPSPTCPNSIGHEQALAARAEGLRLKDRQQIEI